MKIKLSMKKQYKFLFTILLFTAVYVFYGFSQHNNSKISYFLNNELSLSKNNEKILVWVYFTDKGSNTMADAISNLSKESIQRRRLKGKIDKEDIPVYNEYISQVVNNGLQIKQKSKFLNAVSCYATSSQIDLLSRLSFVKKVDLVGKFKTTQDNIEFNSRVQDNTPVSIGTTDNASSFSYGASQTQMNLINAITPQDSGFLGKGIVIAVFDTGFDNLPHPAFDSIRARGLRTYDFVNGDTIVADLPGRMGEGSHGTATLSLIGGYAPGNLVSPAFRSRFILAKTENTDSETPLEEDNWIAAVEWADNLGADIISSSLGYLNMDPGSSRSYDWTWMNGDSTVITKGANHAVDIGIVVCNSAGNNGFNSTRNTLNAPADGKKIICVGSIDTDKKRSSFSSVGLTTIGDIKPDVCAFGNGNTHAQANGGTGYSTGSGTSFSCPMTAGVVAMMLQANGNLTPSQVRQILRTKADSANTPNRLRGWGLINAWESIKLARTFSGISNENGIVSGFLLKQNYPNPFNPVTKIEFDLRTSANVKIIVFDALGKEVKELVSGMQTAGNHSISFDGAGLNSGAYYYALYANGTLMDTKAMMLIK